MVITELFRHEREYLDVPAGQPVFAHGDAGQHMLVVYEGEVDIVVDGHRMETIGPGGVFGEMALIDGAPRSADAIARTAAKLVQIDARRFQFLVQQTPNFALQLLRLLAERLRRTNAWI